MPLVIHDPETIAAIERLAAERGTTEEQALRQLMVPDHRPATPAREFDQQLYEDILRLSRETSAMLSSPLRAADIDELLYDEDGLPK